MAGEIRETIRYIVNILSENDEVLFANRLTFLSEQLDIDTISRKPHLFPLSQPAQKLIQ
ncbi:Uncharacterised protein [Campylobacter jejuni]|nr:Uncharacterised protein [Campylobacter jejuni]